MQAHLEVIDKSTSYSSHVSKMNSVLIKDFLNRCYVVMFFGL